MKSRDMQTAYRLAYESYAKLGINTDKAVAAALQIPISMHCWQVDDVGGFEVKEEGLSDGGRMALMDEMRTMPFGAVWDYLCEKDGIPGDRT